MAPSTLVSDRDLKGVFPGDDESARLMRSLDWSQTPLGPVEQWPGALKSTLGICLTARFPMAVYWGRDLCLLYNDAWRPIVGTKHPWAIGRPGVEVWPEIWSRIHPLFDSVRTTGEATWRSDELLPMHRYGYTEECYFDYTFNPIRDPDGTVCGILNVVQETTYRVLNDRRIRLLRELAHRSSSAKRVQDVYETVMAALATDPADIPFALFYAIDADGQQARLAQATGLSEASPAHVDVVDLGTAAAANTWPLAPALQGSKPIVIDDLAARFGTIAGTFWPEPTSQAFVAPIAVTGGPAAALVLGINPRRRLDEPYRHFLDNVRSHVMTAMANAHAYDAERTRAEALAELNRAKTVFFSNVSHEFRTPLTLMLGPLEEELRERPNSARLEAAHRHSLRLLKLVNQLLDFSRIEAGRVQAKYEPTDLAAYTAEVASVFRSAMEQAGLKFSVSCPPLPEPVYVDRHMWETIVLNLLSNAFKFTFEGRITVGLDVAEHGDGPRHAVLAVSDTGIGIAPEELARVFDRFHRVQGARARTHEGTGIGLALVQELVKLHGGSVEVESTPGRGSRFRVRLPLGSQHLPADRLMPSSGRPAATAEPAATFADEALRWLSDRPGPGSRHASDPSPQAPPAGRREPGSRRRPRVLLADDNADMRDYVERLLSDHYEVMAVADGEAALQAALADPPDVLLTDVMMPGRDGLGLLQAFRSDHRLQRVPVIMVSARAGEESLVEGLDGGADDYLVKPFHAQELLARVKTHLRMAKARAEAEEAIRLSEQRFRQMADDAPMMVWVTEPDGACSFLSKSWCNFTGRSREAGLGSGWWDALHPDDRPKAEGSFASAVAAREPYRTEYRLQRHDGEYRWVLTAAAPHLGERGECFGYIGSTIDIHDRKEAELALERSERNLSDFFENSAIGLHWVDADGKVIRVNQAELDLLGYSREEYLGHHIAEFHADQQAIDDILVRLEQGETLHNYEARLRCKDGSTRDVLISSNVLWEDGSFVHTRCFTRDITERKRAEVALRRQTHRLEVLNRTGAMLTAELDLERLVEAVTDAGRDVSGAEFGAFFYNAENEQGTSDDLFGLSGGPRLASTFPMPADSRIFDPTFKGRGVIRIGDLHRDAAYGANAPQDGMPEQPPVRSYLAVPVISRSGEVLGGLFYGHGEPDKFGEEAEQMVTAIAAQAAIAIDNARLYGQARKELAQRRQAEERERSLADQALAITAKFQAVFNQSGIFAGILDPDGCLREANDAAVARCGYTREQVLDRPFWETAWWRGSEESRARIREATRSAAAGAVFREDLRYWWADGTERLMDFALHPIRDASGAVRFLHPTGIDITDRKRAEEEIAHLAAIVRNSDDAIISKSLRGIVTSWNKGAERLFGYGADEMIGQSIFRIIPPDRYSEEPAILERLAQGESIDHYETVRRHKDGTLLDISLTVSPIRDGQGRIIGASKIARDITAHKRAQDALREAHEVLKQQRSALEDANKELESFSYSVSHDLRAPLRTIDAFSRILIEDHHERLNPEAQRCLDIIRKAAGQGGELIDDLLEFSRLGRQTMQMRAIGTRDLVMEVFHELQASQDGRAVDFLVADLPPCLGDRRLLRLLWVNLLTNAFKYTKYRPSARIEVGWRTDRSSPDHVTYFVKDNGVGFDMKYAHKLFGVFQRLHRKEEFDGTGVGLAIVHRIAKRHGGRVWAEAAVNDGATFSVSLPKASS
ncbi:MAG TPA: PAS domain S-box protein [Nitrospira sp.]|nr:PAS domain S-box protein [Nitrospira sp.]